MHTKKGIVNAHWAPPANNRTPPPRGHAPGVTFSGHWRAVCRCRGAGSQHQGAVCPSHNCGRTGVRPPAKVLRYSCRIRATSFPTRSLQFSPLIPPATPQPECRKTPEEGSPGHQQQESARLDIGRETIPAPTFCRPGRFSPQLPTALPLG